MKRCLPSLLLLLLLLLPAAGRALDFNLRERPAGPGHLTPSYWWNVTGYVWELKTPEKYRLSGGGELRLASETDLQAVVVCRVAASPEPELLDQKDQAAQAKYYRGLLPVKPSEATLVSQVENPLPVNGLTNFEVDFSYDLGGTRYRVGYMVSKVGERDYFTATIQAPEKTYGDLYNAFQRLLATAIVTKGVPTADDTSQIIRHGMLGR